jgi:hypothetical protein
MPSIVSLKAALAATSPYTSQEITQQYQYQKFEAHRECQVEGIVTGEYQRVILGERTISALKAGRKFGVTGVLPQDRTGAANLQPVLMSTADCQREVWAAFSSKAGVAVRDLTATLLAKRAKVAAQASDRLASVMYLSDIAAGTQYDAMKGPIETYISSMVLADEQQWAIIQAPALKVPEEVNAVPETSEQESTRVEAAIGSVVSIEADTGREGSGFFLSASCVVVTNEHVITGLLFGI